MQGCSEKKPVDLKLSVIKPLGAPWMKSAYDYVKSKPEIIQNGFKEAGSCSTGQDDVANYCYRIINYCQCYDCDYM